MNEDTPKVPKVNPELMVGGTPNPEKPKPLDTPVVEQSATEKPPEPSQEPVEEISEEIADVKIDDADLAEMVDKADDQQIPIAAPKAQQGETPRKLSLAILKQRKVMAGIITALLLIVGGAYFVFFGPEEAKEEAASQVVEEATVRAQALTVDYTQSTLDYSSDKGQSWRPLDEEIELVEGLWLRTNKDDSSRGILQLEDGSEVRMDADTAVDIKIAQTDNVLVELIDGQIYARASDVDDRAFTISTDHIEASADGTAYTVSTTFAVDEVAVYEGKITDSKNDFTISQGKKGIYDNDKLSWQSEDLDIEVFKQDEFIAWNRQLDVANDKFSKSLGVLDDLEPPELALQSPTKDQVFVVEDDVSGTDIEFIGSAEVNAAIKVESEKESAEVTAGVDGTFKVVITSLEKPQPGEPLTVGYTVTAADKSGNIAAETINVILESATPLEEITLAAIAQPGAGVILNWTLSEGMEVPDGMRVVWNMTGDPEYPNSPTEGVCNQDIGSQLITEGSTTVACLQDERSYSFRSCRYIASSDSCDVYSNEVSLSAPSGGSD